MAVLSFVKKKALKCIRSPLLLHNSMNSKKFQIISKTVSQRFQYRYQCNRKCNTTEDPTLTLKNVWCERWYFLSSTFHYLWKHSPSSCWCWLTTFRCSPTDLASCQKGCNFLLELVLLKNDYHRAREMAKNWSSIKHLGKDVWKRRN